MAAAALSALLLLALGGCTTPEPPEPTPTPAFSSEAEAFAAAEETYRAYVDAVNGRREDRAGLPEPTDFLVGDALEAEIETENIKASEGLSITGETLVTGAEGVSWNPHRGELDLIVCVDSSETTVRDATGADVTPSDRMEIYAMLVHFELLAETFVIASTQQSSESTC